MKPSTFYRFALTLIPLISCGLTGLTQFGNEWIHYDQPYWKFPVFRNNLLRICAETLIPQGFPVGINPETIRVIFREKEVFVHITGANDESFDSDDCIEFLGNINDGWLDSLVWDQTQHLANPFFSQFNDTAYAFITIGPSPGLRTSLLSHFNYSSFEPEAYCFFRSLREYHAEYLIGRADANGISLPTYGQAEGWMSARFPKGASLHSDLSTPNAHSVSTAPPARVTAVSAGASAAEGSPNHHLQVGWGNPFNLVTDTLYSGHQLNKFEFAIPASALGSATTRITHRSVDDLGVAADNHSVAWASLTYPHTWNFSDYNVGQAFYVRDLDNSGWIRFDIIALSIDSPRFFICRNGLQSEIISSQENGVWKILFPVDDNQLREIRIFSQQTSITQNSVTKATSSGYFTNYQAAETDSAFLIITHPTLWNASLSYAAWRQQNGHSVRMANVQELFLQYGGGIPSHPLAISRYCKHLTDTWPSPPAHLFLIGKSIHEMTIGPNTGSRISPSLYSRNLVPSWGWPSSDALFTARWNAPLYNPSIPTGRLAAETPQQVLDYLAKIVQHESQPQQRWQKNILHFGGGGNAFEQGLFKSYLSGYEQLAKDTSFGAQVYTFLKNTTDPIQMNLSDSIRHLIDEGAAVLTFFGHASSTGFDQNLDEPANYNNPGRYPLLIGNSCYTGNIHLAESMSASERFVHAPQRGVIGFVAKPDLGIPAYLDMFTAGLYRHLFRQDYGKTVGQCMRESVLDFQQAGDFYRENTALTFALHGDPAVRIYPRTRPDFDLHAADITFDPPQISAQVDSFRVVIQVHNTGKATNQPVAVELIRHYPDGSDSSLVAIANRILNRETISFTLPVDPSRALGVNYFDILVDLPSNQVDELDDYSNNAVYQIPLHITSGELIPVVPPNFAVVPEPLITLYASTGDPLEPLRTYRIQIDTTDAFNSPWMLEFTATQKGGVVEWTLPFSLTDSTVYFWRCSADSLSPDQSFRWRAASFQYISGQTGWGQDHFYQFGQNGMGGLTHDRDSRTWGYEPFNAALRCEVFGNPSTSFEALGTRYLLNLDVQDYSGPGNLPCLLVAVMDSVTLLPWQSNFNGSHPGNDFGNSMISANARSRPEKYFIFEQNQAAQLSGMANMLTSGIPDGNYVLIYSWRFALPSIWASLSPELVSAFNAAGAGVLTASSDSLPFIFFFQKGSPSTAQLLMGSQPGDDLIFETQLNGRTDFGILRSPDIGPSLSWSELNWRIATAANGSPETEIRLLGISGSGSATALSEWAIPAGLETLLPLINAAEFPKIRLEARIADPADEMPPQADRWHVIHQPVPECVIDPATAFSVTPGPLKEGQIVELSVAVRNISSFPMDSLLISYRIEDAQRVQHQLPQPRREPLLAGQVLIDTIRFSTTGFGGRNILFIEANPYVSPGKTDQPEQQHFNNVLQYSFTVEEDRTNPLLDVTFDGLHILNRDVVSARPEIQIRLDDDNEFLLLNEPTDTAFFRVFLQEPSSPVRPVYFSDPSVLFIPADDSRNRSRIEYRPLFSKDGIHTLLVQARDKSGNASGRTDYKIEFEVINRPGISEVLNYPNPFSTSTRFVFTLTGSEVPDQMKIQIMTIGGRIVREITQSELGPLRIGRNITDFQWDGRDEFGDLLANGVYLYRVTAKLRGQELETKNLSSGSFSNKGFGKMYLFR